MLSLVLILSPASDGTQTWTEPALTVHAPWSDDAGRAIFTSPALSVRSVRWIVAPVRSTRREPAFAVRSTLARRLSRRSSMPRPAFIVSRKVISDSLGRDTSHRSGPLPKPGRKNSPRPPLSILSDRAEDAMSG